MPRRRRLRKIVAPPNFKGYKPYGAIDHGREAVELLYEEYEAIKLADYDLLNHQQAAGVMGVSRATFARIYEEARRKIAKALTEAREIVTVYGNAVMDKSWNVCDNCHARFTIPKRPKDHNCPICGSERVSTVGRE